jgi:hypothetical protein
MIRQVLLLVLMLPLVACGWTQQCIKPTSYNLGEEKIAVVGSAMVQIGCLAAQWERRGEIQPDPYFEPLIDKELLYAGRVGDNLHISYREYFIDINAQKNRWGSYARPPFFQQAYYDLKTSDTVVFQDWVLQVIDANNERIRFKVIKGPLRSIKFEYLFPQAN